MSNTIGSSTVDERIVEMRIDNAKFEAGAKKTIGILESLDRSLKGLSSENVDGFESIGDSLDKVTDRFSAFGIVGDQIMRNLTNRAMELVSQVKNMTTMLTTQQIGAGWDKYADKTSAIQTIMAATSKKIDEGFFADQAEQMEWVNEQIEKLNAFTDETSYNFLDMVGNIGKFTSAGRELEESVRAMEGIANWAALSGGTPAEASRAMYNLSQALGMGAVTTIDWKSIENANMATYEFKQQAIDTAVELGRLTKVADGLWETVDGGFEVTIENFRNSLSFGRGTDAVKWFDSDVLLTVLDRYGKLADELIEVSDNSNLSVTQWLSLIQAYKSGDPAFQKEIENLSLTSQELQEIMPDLQRFSAAEYDLGLRAFQAAQEAKTFTEAIDATKDAVSTKWMTVFELLFGNYLEAKELWIDMANTFWDIFAKPVDHLIDIIENAGGFIGEEGFAGSMEQAAGGTAALERSLQAAGKTMEDFYVALEQTLGPDESRKLVDAWGSIEEALLNGAVSADKFRGALGKLDDSYDDVKTVSLDRALNRAGKTMDDFEKSIMQVGGPAALELVKNFGSVEEALRQGGIWADLFDKALNNIGIDSENVSQSVEETVQASVASMEEMRAFALEVLRGDHGNGEERLAWYESMGLDAEIMQAMAGNLLHIGQDISDEYLAELMEIYWQAQGLSERLGYATFAEYIASRQAAVEGYVDEMEVLASESERLYASLFGEDILDEAGEYYSAGELFRKSITNLLEALGNFGEAFDKAFMRVFGGDSYDNYDNQIAKMSDGFFTLTAAFYSFSKKVKSFSESETLLNFMTTLFSTLRLIGNVLGVVFKIGKAGLSFVLKLLSPVFTLVSAIFDGISAGVNMLSDSLENSGFLALIGMIGDELQEKLAEPIENINKVITALVDAFREGFSEGGIMGGLEKMSEAIDVLFQNHPIFLTVVHALGQALLFLKDALAGAALAVGGLLGGAVTLLIAGFQQLGEWFGQFIDWAKDTELVMGIWNGLTEAFAKLGNVIQRVFGYAQQGYQEGGFMGALSALGQSLERGVRRLLPGGNALMDFFASFADEVDESKPNSSVTRIKKSVNKMRPSIDTVRNAIERLHDGSYLGVRQIERVGDAVEKLEPKITRAAKVVETVTDGMFGDEEQKKTFKERVADFIQTVWDGILQGLRKITIKDVIGAMRLSLIASITTKLIDAITIFTDIKESIRSIPDSLAKVGEKFANMMQGLAATFTANAVLKFAVAALLLSFVLAKLAKIPKEDLTHAAGTLIVILSVLALLANGLGKFKMGTASVLAKIPNMTGVLIGLAATLIAFTAAAVALTLIQFLGPEKFNKTIEMMGVFMISMIAIMGILLVFASKVDPDKIQSMSKFLMSVGGAMVMIGIAVSILAGAAALMTVVQLIGGSRFATAVGVIAGMMVALIGILTLLMAFLNKSVSQPKKIETMGKTMQKIAGAFIVVSLAVGMLALPIAMLAIVSSLFKANIAEAGLTIGLVALGLATAIGILIAFLESEAGSPKKIETMAKSIKKIAWSLFTVAAAVTLMTVPILLLAKAGQMYGTGGMLGAFGSLVAIMVLLTGLLWITSKISGNKKGDGLLKFAAAMALLSLGVLMTVPAIILLAAAIGYFGKKLGEMDEDAWEKFANGLKRLHKLAFAMIMIGLGLLALGAGGIAASAGVISISVAILLLVGAVAVLMFALPGFIKTLEELKDTSLKDLGASLGKVAVAAVVFMAIFGGLLLMLSRFFKFLSADNLEKTGNGFSKFFKGLASGAAASTSSGFSKVIKALQDPEKRKAITGTIATLVTVAALYISDLIPTFTKVIVGGIVQLISSIATELSENGGPLVDAITELISAVVGIVKDLIARLFGEESWDEMSWWQKGLADIGGGVFLLSKLAGLVSFGNAEGSAGKLSEKIFSATNKVTDMKEEFDSVKAALELADEASGGWLTTLGLIGVVVAGVAAAMEYAASCIDEQQQLLRENVGDPKTIEEYDDAITKAEAHLARLQEDYDLYGGGGGMELTAQEIDAYTLLIAEMKNERETLAESPPLPVEETRDYITELQGLGEAWKNASGKDKIDHWQAYNRLLNEGSEVMGITTDELDNMAGGYKRVKEEAIAATSEMKALQEQNTKDAEAMTEGTNMVNAAADNLLSKTDLIKQKLSELGVDENATIGDIIGSIGKEKFQEILNSAGIEFDLSTVGIGGTEEWGAQLKEIAGDAAPGLVEALGDWITDENNLGSYFGDIGTFKDFTVDEFFKVFQMGSPSRVMADEVGRWIPPGIGVGISEHQSEATSPIIDIIRVMLNMFEVSNDNFEMCGRNVVVGLANGIVSNLEIAYRAGKNAAESVESGFRDKLSIRSPSRVFAELARFIPLGIAEGVEDGSTSAVSSVTVLGDALIDAIMGSMAMVSAAADDEFEITPYIRPVVDLSDVKNASGYVNGVFGDSYGLSGEIGTSISRRLQQTRIASANKADGGSTVNSNDNITINIYTHEGMDENAVADAVMERMGSRFARRGMAYG